MVDPPGGELIARGRLTDFGARVGVVLRNERHWQEFEESEARSTGIERPRAVHGLAVLDTGAAMSMVCPDRLDRLGAMHDKVVRLQGIGPSRPWSLGEPFECVSRYVEVEIIGLERSLTVSVAPVPVGELFGEEVVAVLGRDVLDRLVVRLDGPARELTVEWPR